MNHAKLFSVFVSISILTYGAIAFYFLPIATFQGELTRMALLPESLFGWTKPQAQLDVQWMQQATMQEADVLVIGDSFSDSRVWQTVLTQHQLKVRTVSWNSMQGICSDFSDWAKAQGFRGKYVVAEIVERNLIGTLQRSMDCKQTQYRTHSSVDAPRYPPAASFDPTLGNYAGQLSTGIQTRINVHEYEVRSGARDFQLWEIPNNVKVARVNNGCAYFSHARCNDALFLGEDEATEVNAKAFDLVAAHSARLQNFTAIWVVVPNKATTYLYPHKTFWQEAERRLSMPNLLQVNQRALHEKTVDLYPANNTHYSTTGYLLMGDAIYKTMRQAAGH
ncbi:MAG: hypothetical protein HOP24_08950 [Sideroxydans sp.]|nr:hypothetical protein [Sideroxydans sp.]